MLTRIAVTGGNGNIAYQLLFRIASGELLGKDVPIALHILELESGIERLKGVVMELEDCGFSSLFEIHIGSDPYQLFEGVDIAILVGAKPRGPGMERKDLLAANGNIFAEQGRALNAVASKDVHVFVIGNPCNTNCLIAMHSAPSIPRKQFYAMTYLDQHRARFQLAKYVNIPVSAVKDVFIWGNHSSTQVPDIWNATINGKAVSAVIKDEEWMTQSFVKSVQNRGAAVINQLGRSSGASAAQSILDTVRSTRSPGPAFSLAMCSDNNPYGIAEDLVFSFPCIYDCDSGVTILEGFSCKKIEAALRITEKELIKERDAVKHLFNKSR